jgi:hypothetical protein
MGFGAHACMGKMPVPQIAPPRRAVCFRTPCNTDRKMAAKTKKPKELYLKIPYHILNIEGLGLSEKVLLAHIYSFGEKGCWQSNATLARIFMTSPRTIKRWLANIVREGHVQIKSPKGYYRTIWARSHPAVREAAQLFYRGKKDGNKEGRKCPTRRDKNGTVSVPKGVLRPGRNCPTTNNTTNKDTNEETTAPPSPLPAGGQASAVLAERKKSAQSNIKRFGKNFGSANTTLRRTLRSTSTTKDESLRSTISWKPPSEEEFENRRQRQIKALLG